MNWSLISLFSLDEGIPFLNFFDSTECVLEQSILARKIVAWVALSVRSILDFIRHKKGEGVAVMADDQPTGKAFHSRLVDPDFSVAGIPLFPCIVRVFNIWIFQACSDPQGPSLVWF